MSGLLTILALGTGESASQTDNSSASQTDSGQGKDLNTAEPTQSGDTASETGTGSATGKKTGKGTGKATGTKTGKTHSTFAPDSPPGGVSMLTPAPNLQATPLYKIGDDVTWSWNYTSLQGTPTAVDVLVSCSVASNTWTLTSNMTFATSVNYVWETKEEAGSVQNPLLTEMYTLIVKDSDTQITSAPEPGYLAPGSSSDSASTPPSRTCRTASGSALASAAAALPCSTGRLSASLCP